MLEKEEEEQMSGLAEGVKLHILVWLLRVSQLC